MYVVSKEENSARCKLYYEQNKEKRKANITARQRRIKLQVQSYKLTRGCDICGYRKSARALQFHHHNNDKVREVGRMTSQGCTFDRIMLEAAKCQLVCANCHAELHAEQSDCLRMGPEIDV